MRSSHPSFQYYTLGRSVLGIYRNFSKVQNFAFFMKYCLIYDLPVLPDKNSYRIRIKVRWCRDSILQKKFWKFIAHPRTTAHNYAHSRTPEHTCAHPHTLTYTQKHPTHTRSWLELDKSYQITVNRKTAEETKKERKKEKGRNKSPLKHFSGLKMLSFVVNGTFCILEQSAVHFTLQHTANLGFMFC